MAPASADATTDASARPSAIVFDMDRAVGAASQRFANHLRDARGTGRADHHFAAALLLEPQRLLERVGVRLVHLVRRVRLADPGLVVVEPRLAVAGEDVLDTDRNLHVVIWLDVIAIVRSACHERHGVTTAPAYEFFLACSCVRGRIWALTNHGQDDH